MRCKGRTRVKTLNKVLKTVRISGFPVAWSRRDVTAWEGGYNIFFNSQLKIFQFQVLFSSILDVDVNMKEKTSVSTLFMSHFVKLQGGSNNIQLRNVSFCQI